MISMDKKYRYRNGDPARILCVDGANKILPVVSTCIYGRAHIHRQDGRHLNSMDDSSLDLIEVSPWDDFKIDEPVMVRDSDIENWCMNNFAGIDGSGKPLTWYGGKTSWTSGEQSYGGTIAVARRQKNWMASHERTVHAGAVVSGEATTRTLPHIRSTGNARYCAHVRA